MTRATNAHRIDQDIQKISDYDPSTAGQVRAAEWGCKAWALELHRVFDQLMSMFNESEQEVLRNAQQAWIVFRDMEFKLLETIYAKMEGTMYRPMQVFARMNIIKARALQLEHRLEELGVEIHKGKRR